MRELLLAYTNWLLEHPGWFAEPEATMDAFIAERTKRDERWENMYACIAPFVQDLDDGYVTLYKFGVYVWWNDYFYFHETVMTEETLKYAGPDTTKVIFTELIKLVDEDMEERDGRDV